jgi:hypothetical protein
MTPRDTPLTPDERRWLTCWRCMDDRRREENLPYIELQAEQYPRRKAPRLILIPGGAE